MTVAGGTRAGCTPCRTPRRARPTPLETLSSSWGYRETASGKAVYFTLAQ